MCFSVYAPLPALHEICLNVVHHSCIHILNLTHNGLSREKDVVVSTVFQHCGVALLGMSPINSTKNSGVIIYLIVI